MSVRSPSRRAFLTGIGGVTLALPILESLRQTAYAQDATPHYSVFVRQANGVCQESNGEPEQYWPSALGPITSSSLAAEPDRAVTELADYADRMLLVKGADFAFDSNGCGHSGGGNQCLTAARVSDSPSGAYSLAEGESIDNYIARMHSQNGGEPLTLYTGPRGGYLDEVLSYRGPQDRRSAEDDPWNAYQRMVGGDGPLDRLLEGRRKSVNDLVRAQMKGLLGRSDLSKADRDKLDLHFTSVREFEKMSCYLSEDEEQAMASMLGQGTLNDNRETVAKMHMDLIAIAFACDFARTATLQIGDGNDSTEFTINGERLPSFHMISHRIYGDGDEGDPIVGAIEMHHNIDVLFLRMFRHLLEKLDGYDLLDQSVAVLTNDLSNPTHSFRDIPYVIVGQGDGTLKQGAFVDGGGVTHNKVLNTLITATGLRTASGGPIEDFGDASLDGGMMPEMLA